jgi:superfamily II DNA or RNA helicase
MAEAEEPKATLPCEVKSSNLAKNSPFLFFDRAAFNAQETAENAYKLAPKAVEIYKNIRSIPGKHVVYSADSNFLKVMAGYLISQGLDFAIGKSMKLLPRTSKPMFVLLPKSGGTMFGKPVPQGYSGSLDPARQGLKIKVLNRFNDKTNATGKDISILLISSTYREGINIYDAVAMHVVEPFVREADQTQAIGRVIRRCGHRFTPWQAGGWKIKVFTYDVKLRGVSATNLTMVKSQLREQIKSKAVDLLLTNTAKATAEGSTLAAGYYNESSVLTGRLVKELGRLEEMLPVAFAHRITPEQFQAWWKIAPRERQGPKMREHQFINKTVIARGKVVHLKNHPYIHPHDLKNFLVGLFSKSPEARIGMAQVRRDARGYVKRNLSAIKETREMWSYHLTPITLSAVDRPMETPIVNTKIKIPVAPFKTQAEANRFIKDSWMAYVWPLLANEAVNLCTDDAGLVLSPTQAFVSEYFVPECPFKGFIAFHSVGSGKTILGASVCKRFQSTGYKCIWITRTELRKNVEADFIKDKFPISLLDDVLSFKMASNAMSGKNDRLKKVKGPDLLEKTLLIIDEAHLLFNGTLPKSERAEIAAIQKAVAKSYAVSGANSCRVLAMSGTLDESDKVWNGIYELCGSHEFGNISYLDISANYGMFAKPEFIDASFNLEEPHDILAKLALCGKAAGKKPRKANDTPHATSSADTVAPKKPRKAKAPTADNVAPKKPRKAKAPTADNVAPKKPRKAKATPIF